jgi:hypothetical protein
MHHLEAFLFRHVMRAHAICGIAPPFHWRVLAGRRRAPFWVLTAHDSGGAIEDHTCKRDDGLTLPVSTNPLGLSNFQNVTPHRHHRARPDTKTQRGKYQRETAG